MIVNLNPNVSICKKRKTAFGNERSANLVKNAIQSAISVKDPALRMTKEKALERIAIALKSEDKEGASILKKFKNALEKNLLL